MANEQKNMNRFPKCQWKQMLEWINIQFFLFLSSKTKAKPDQQVGTVLAYPLRFCKFIWHLVWKWLL